MFIYLILRIKLLYHVSSRTLRIRTRTNKSSNTCLKRLKTHTNNYEIKKNYLYQRPNISVNIIIPVIRINKSELIQEHVQTYITTNTELRCDNKGSEPIQLTTSQKQTKFRLNRDIRILTAKQSKTN